MTKNKFLLFFLGGGGFENLFTWHAKVKAGFL